MFLIIFIIKDLYGVIYLNKEWFKVVFYHIYFLSYIIQEPDGDGSDTQFRIIIFINSFTQYFSFIIFIMTDLYGAIYLNKENYVSLLFFYFFFLRKMPSFFLFLNHVKGG